MPPGAAEPRSPGETVVSSGWLAVNSMSEDRRTTRAFGASLATFLLHGLLLLLATLAIAQQAQAPLRQELMPAGPIIYIAQSGPGGGGGGSPAPAPAKRLSVPKTAPPEPIPTTPQRLDPEPPMPRLMAPIISTVSGLMQATGVSSVSLSAYGGGGRGDGSGPGTGPGIGPGRDGGFGDDAYRPGGGIASPVPIRKPTPSYTAEAMRNKIQGSVEVEAVVLEDGTVGDVRIAKSLDRTSGMDLEALKVARQWLFQPARDPNGKPVKTIVRLIFDLRLF